MMFSTLQYTLATYLYPLPSPPPPRRTKQLQVLCLGLPRSGTDSLRHALLCLGLSQVSHGLDFWANYIHHSPLYTKVALLRSQNSLPASSVLRTEYFDRMLGDCEATTDIPTVWFSHELLAAYPDAKVVLNRRNDVKAWKKSFQASVLPILENWEYWLHSWFDAELFWGLWLSRHLHLSWLFEGDFENTAERVYEEYYENLEKELERNGRDFLRWGVEDGWEPLCRFLEKPVPDGKFPEGNVAAEFGPKLMVKDKARFANARKNAFLLAAGIMVPVALFASWSWSTS